jgi:hypothetical protein
MSTQLLQQNQNLLSTMQFATSNGREIISTASEGVQMRNLTEDEPIKQAFRYIFTLIGLKAENIPSDLQKAVLINYVRTELGSFTPDELCLAFRLAVSKRLDVEINHFQNFNAIYLSEVLEAYRRQRSAALIEYNREMKKLESESENEVSPERKLSLFWEYIDTVILQLWDDYVKTNKIEFGHYRVASIFDIFENQFCFLALTKDEKIEIKKRAEQSAKNQLETPVETLEKIREIRQIKQTIESGMNHIGFENMIVTKCKEIAIRDFFSKLKTSGNDLRKMIDQIRPNFKLTS